LGAVSAGAELLADGNIHVYGPLRGRALAGVKGDTEMRIFCQSLEAELVSIAGRYRVIEQLDEAERGRPVQMYLVADRLVIEPLTR
jgi:septum site-determining protein MinC